MVKNFLNRFIHLIYNYVQILYGYLVKYLSPIIPLPPLTLRIRITNRCNLHCDFCYLAGDLNAGEENHLEVSEWKKIIKKLPRTTIVDITGAEPFLAKNFSTILNLFLERKMKVSLITNGLKVDDEIIEDLVKNKLFYLMLSVDGFNEMHNKMRGNKRSFENIEQFIERVNHYKKVYNSKYPIICIKTTVLEENVTDFKNIGDYFFSKLNIDQHSLNLLFSNKVRGGKKLISDIDSQQFYSGNQHSYNPDKIEHIIKHTSEYMDYAKYKNWNINIKPPIKRNRWADYIKDPRKYGVKSCIRPYSVASIYYDGTITPCDINFSTGNIRDYDYDIKKIWSLPSFKSFIDKHFKKKKYLPACDGCCLAEQSVK
jgi:MoaA/NifB/PqqE/SkfB family radical SAM enzyme